jgi:hypothetical protein
MNVMQLQAVIAVQGSWLIRKARFVQRRIQKIARTIASEHASRAIRSMRRRRKSQN